MQSPIGEPYEANLTESKISPAGQPSTSRNGGHVFTAAFSPQVLIAGWDAPSWTGVDSASFSGLSGRSGSDVTTSGRVSLGSRSENVLATATAGNQRTCYDRHARGGECYLK